MTMPIQNDEGILLEIKKAGEGGRFVRLFSRKNGTFSAFISRPALTRCGTGALFPFARLRYSWAGRGDMAVLTQYEGRLSLHFLSLDYHVIVQWYYAAEIVITCFPEGEKDPEVFDLLKQASFFAVSRNQTISAMILSVQLLALAGIDPAEEDPMDALRLPGEARSLLRAFRAFPWKGDLGMSVKRATFAAAARYIDRFILSYGGISMKTSGAFLEEASYE